MIENITSFIGAFVLAGIIWTSLLRIPTNFWEPEDKHEI